MAKFIEVTPRDPKVQLCNIEVSTIRGVVLVNEGGDLICVIHTTWTDPMPVEESSRTVMARIGSDK